MENWDDRLAALEQAQQAARGRLAVPNQRGRVP